MSRRNKHAVFCENFLDRILSERCMTGLSGNAFAVAYVLARHFNAKTKLAWPGQKRICDLACLSEAAVKRAVKELEDAGYIEIWVSYGRGKANTYRPIPPKKGSFANPFNRRNRTQTAPPGATKRSTNAPTKPLKYIDYGKTAEQRGANVPARMSTSAMSTSHVVDCEKTSQHKELSSQDDIALTPEKGSQTTVKGFTSEPPLVEEAADGTPAPASGALTGPEPSPTAAKEFGAMLDDGNGKPIWLEGIRHKPRELYTEKPDLLIGARIESDKMVGTIIGYHDTEFALVRFDAQMVGGVHVDEMVAWTKISDITVTAPPAGYQVGDKVRHLRYGIGIVVVVDGSTCEVDFKSGRKRIMRSFIDPVATAA